MEEALRRSDILVVDDDPVNLRLISSILKEKDYAVRTLSSAPQLFALLEKSMPDLILLDVMMPERSGYDLCRCLKQEERFAEIPVIFLTSLNDSESIMRCFQVGAADYLSKPVNPQELFARIETHLNLKINAEKLREARRELCSFNQLISHDLKSPILLVKKLAGYLEAYQDDVRDPDYAEILLGIRRKTEEIVCVMEKYSELSRLSCMKPQREPVDLNALFREILEEMNARAAAVVQTEDLPVIRGDRLLLKCAFSNAVGNALKFSRNSRPPVIRVGSRKRDGVCRIFVKDNGVGFNMKYSARLFEMFTRLHSQNDFEGTGTGLAIVKKITDLHRGRVWMEAAENEGATIFFEFPDDEAPA